MAGVTYEMRGKAVVITNDDTGGTAAFDYENLQLAIDNRIKNREHYRTDEAWRKDLAIYRGAMAYLREHLTVADVLEATP